MSTLELFFDLVDLEAQAEEVRMHHQSLGDLPDDVAKTYSTWPELRSRLGTSSARVRITDENGHPATTISSTCALSGIVLGRSLK